MAADNVLPPLPPPPPPPAPPPPQQSSLTYPYSLNFQSSTSVAIIIVVLGATFFFMFLFVIYIKRCNMDRFDHQQHHHPSDTATDGGSISTASTAAWIHPSSRIHGLDPDVLQKFPVLRFPTLDRSTSGKNTARRTSGSIKKKNSSPRLLEGPIECAVCLGSFEEGEFLRILPACGHLFHPECIDAWLHTHSTCPLCRRSLSRDAMSGHLLQKALAAIASLRGFATTAGSNNEVESSSPDSSTTSLSPHRLAPLPSLPEPAAAARDPGEGELDVESQRQGEILRTLSRNSESFKVAAQSVEIQDMLVLASSSSSAAAAARYLSPSSTILGLVVSPGTSERHHVRAMSPIACGPIHHSQSLSNLAAAAAAAANSSPGCALCCQTDQQQSRLWRSVSASGERRDRIGREP